LDKQNKLSIASFLLYAVHTVYLLLVHRLVYLFGPMRRYLSPVMGEGLQNQTFNPEVRIDINDTSTVIETAKLQLRQATIQLRNAFIGHPRWFLNGDGMVSDKLRLHLPFIYSRHAG